MGAVHTNGDNPLFFRDEPKKSRDKSKQKRKTATAKSEQSSVSGTKSLRVGKKGGGAGRDSREPGPGLCCNVCKKAFNSRNKLFQHIKDTGHAVKLQISSEDRTKIDQSRKGKKKK